MDYLAHPIVPPSGPTHSYKQVKRAAFSQCWRIFKMACGKAPQERTYGICRTASSGIRTASRSYIGNDAPGSMVDQGRYDRSKDRETRWNESWKRQPVDLNDIVSRFTPGAQGRRRGVKYVFENARWRIDADMVAGYLRIYDKRTKKNVKLNGLPGSNKETHFKILKRREM